jgi:low temperature requirement protein LtrA
MSVAIPKPRGVRARDPDDEQRVTPLELFFDLVFVFALTQVTGLLAGDPTWGGLVRGLLVLAALWWAWVAYSWLTDAVDPEEDAARVSVFVAMTAMLIAALAVPGAFGGDALLFGCAYFVVRAMHIVLYRVAAADDPALKFVVGRLAMGAITGPSLLILASAFDGVAQGVIWGLALLVDYAGVLLARGEGWTIAPAHFAERYGLIVIIALGESIVAIGAGAGIELGAGEVVAAVFAILVSAALWWAYFDVVAIVAERKLTEATGAARTDLARDSYSYLHLPMVAGIVLLALGIKKTLADMNQPLDTIPAVALCGGVALYLLGHIAFRLRNVHSLNRQRLVAACACLALIPVALEADALVALGAVTAVCVLLIAYEVIRFGEARARLHAAARG